MSMTIQSNVLISIANPFVRCVAVSFFQNIFEQIRPRRLYKNRLETFFLQNNFSWGDYGSIYLLGLGKAATLESRQFMDFVKERFGIVLDDYLIITKHGYAGQEKGNHVFESSHPYLDEKSFEAAKVARNFLSKTDEKSLIFILVSGGTSALIEDFPSAEREQLVKKFNELVNSGISIDELNHLRKVFSNVKNMRLIKDCPGKVVSLLTSDIPSNDAYLIGSSPSLLEEIPQRKRETLIKKYGMENFSEAESVPFERKDDQFEVLISFHNLIPICSSLLDGQIRFRQKAYNDQLNDVWRDYLADLDVEQINLSFGEINVEVKGSGLGGRNTHFVLFIADKVFGDNCLNLTGDQLNSLVIFSVGTDGSDGPTDASGAWITFEKFNSVPHFKFLENFDSYNYFSKLGTLVKSGPTGTNLMDVRGVGPKHLINCQT